LPVATRQPERALQPGATHYSFKILIIAGHAPTVNHAGGLRMLDMMRIIKSRHPNVYLEVFTPMNKALYGPIDKLIQIADKVVIAEGQDFSLQAYLRRSPSPYPFFDVIDFQFSQPIEQVKGYRAIGAKLIFTPMESNIRNEIIDGCGALLPATSLKSAAALEEQAIIQTVDQTICVSEMDRAVIAKHTTADVIAIETGISEIEFSGSAAPRMQRSDPLNVCFVAYFGSETNRVALKWYLKNVHPLVLKQMPDYTFSIIGRGDIGTILQPMPERVAYIGAVDRIEPYLDKADIGIAPALSGSGFRGKINQYAFLGLPTVASPLAAEGLAYVNEDSILIAKAPEDFAKGIIRLLQDQDLRNQMAQKAFAVTQAHYTWDSKWPSIVQAYNLPKPRPPLAEPSIHAVVPSYQHAAYIEDRIRSIFAQHYRPIRVTVIDDHSSDGSDAVIRKLQEEFSFDYIRREENSGSPFNAWEYAAANTTEDLIWICESDDLADPMMVPKLVKLMQSRQTAKIAYCASWIIDDDSKIVGTTDSYLESVFHPYRWKSAFYGYGKLELDKYLRFGMFVPNMSGALIDRQVFKKAMTANIKSYKLAGDWLFMGQAMQYGDIVYTPDRLNLFRRHEQTARNLTKAARSFAEHISVRLTLSRLVISEELELLNAIKHDLRGLRDAPDLIPLVRQELQTLDPASLDQLNKLLDSHLMSDAKSTILRHRPTCCTGELNPRDKVSADLARVFDCIDPLPPTDQP
jgi:glycosyltransferase involved in cell wall biosynthesis